MERHLFTNKEISRFSSFVYLINKIDAEERLISEGQKANSTDSEGGKTQVIFYIGHRLLGTMNRIANNMYNGNSKEGVPGLKDDPWMKQICDQALENLMERKAKRQDNELKEAVEIWNRV